jgi:hypothetical protein
VATCLLEANTLYQHKNTLTNGAEDNALQIWIKIPKNIESEKILYTPGFELGSLGGTKDAFTNSATLPLLLNYVTLQYEQLKGGLPFAKMSAEIAAIYVCIYILCSESALNFQ